MKKGWMPLYTGDYLRDTRHLTLDQHGLYFLLIMLYWDIGPLPNDEKKLAKMLGLHSRSFRAPFKVVSRFFYEANAKQLLRHNRIDQELSKAEIISQKRALAGAKGGFFNRGKSNVQRLIAASTAKQMVDQSQSHSKNLSYLVRPGSKKESG